MDSQAVKNSHNHFWVWEKYKVTLTFHHLSSSLVQQDLVSLNHPNS